MGNNAAVNVNEKPGRQMEVSPFSIGVYEITHDQFDIFLKMKKLRKGQRLTPSPDLLLST